MHIAVTGDGLPKGMLSVFSQTFRGWGSAAHIEGSGIAVAADKAAPITLYGKNGVLHDSAQVTVSMPTQLTGTSADIASDLLSGYSKLAAKFGERHVGSAAEAVDPHANAGAVIIRTDAGGNNFVLNAAAGAAGADGADAGVNQLFATAHQLSESAGIKVQNISMGA